MAFLLHPFQYLFSSSKEDGGTKKLDCGIVKLLFAKDSADVLGDVLFHRLQTACAKKIEVSPNPSNDCATVLIKLKHIKAPNLLEALLLKVPNSDYFEETASAQSVLEGDVIVVCVPLDSRETFMRVQREWVSNFRRVNPTGTKPYLFCGISDAASKGQAVNSTEALLFAQELSEINRAILSEGTRHPKKPDPFVSPIRYIEVRVNSKHESVLKNVHTLLYGAGILGYYERSLREPREFTRAVLSNPHRVAKVLNKIERRGVPWRRMFNWTPSAHLKVCCDDQQRAILASALVLLRHKIPGHISKQIIFSFLYIISFCDHKYREQKRG